MHQSVLYVGAHKSDETRLCDGSSMCARLMEYLPEGAFRVVQCQRNTKPENSPAWLLGTPTLFMEDEVYTGRYAVEKLHDVVVSFESGRAYHRGKSENSKNGTSSRMSRHQPPQQHSEQHPVQQHPAEHQQHQEVPTAEEEAEHSLSAMFTSKEEEVGSMEEEESAGDGKMTGDDLARAISQRETAKLKPRTSGPPPPPPPQERD